MSSFINKQRRTLLAPKMNRCALPLLALPLVLVACTQEQLYPDTSKDLGSETQMSKVEARALLHERHARLTDRSSKTGLKAYDTLQPIDGTRSWRPLPTVSESESTIPAEALAKVEEYAAKNNSSALLVWRDGKLEFERYFDQTNSDTLLNAKSLAKPLGVIAVGRAIAEGFIKSLDQPVADFLHEWRGTPKQSISVGQLIGMRSGLMAQGPTDSADSVMTRAYLDPYFENVLINEYPMVREPGTRYDYSNAAAELVSPLIKRATGQSYQSWLGTEVLQALGAKGGEIWMGRPNGTAHAGCCVLLPAETYLRVAVLVLQGGMWEGHRLLPQGFVEQMSTVSEQNPHAGLGLYVGSPFIERRGAANPDVPYGKVLHSEPYLAEDLVLFDGNSNQVAYIVPSKKLVVLRTGNWAPKEPEWDNAFIPNTILRSIDDKPKQVGLDRRFANAMQHHAPLGLVRGVETRDKTGSPNKPARELADTIEYARAESSYALIIWHKGQILVEEYFENFTADLRPDTASMHKSVLALLVAAAIEDGFIQSVKDPIGRYLEHWQATPEGQITIENLLYMSSGLENLSLEGGMDSPRVQFVFKPGARETLMGLRLEVEPGTRFLYANTSSQILNMVLESAVGRSYATYLSERLWTRIGASDAYVWNYEEDGFPRTYTALLATPRDWLKLGLLVKDRGLVGEDQIIAANLIDQMTTPSPLYPNYGWHLWLGNLYEEQRFYNDAKTGASFSSAEPFLAEDMIYFDGIGGQRVYVSREQDLVVVRVGDMRMEWDDSKLPNMVIRALEKRATTDSQRLSATN